MWVFDCAISENHNQWLLTKRHKCPTSTHVFEFLIVVIIGQNQALDFWEPWLSRCKIALVPRGVWGTNNLQTLVCLHEGVDRHCLQNSKKGHERSGLRVLNRIFPVLGSQEREYLLGLGANPIKIPWIVVLDILLVSYPMPYMVCFGPLSQPHDTHA
jgi:hypothetical protein